MNYRHLNSPRIADSYPFKILDDCLDSLGNESVLFTFDSMAGYWNVPASEEYRDKTKFTTHMGTFRYRWMLSGIRDAPTNIQRALYRLRSAIRCNSCLFYLDDDMVFSANQ